MKFKAVIFDLFGTLVDKFPIDESIDILRQMAAALPVPEDDLIKLWFATFDERHGGDFQNQFQVYQRGEEPCYQCGTPIQRIVVGQRGTHFCPQCQQA